jgi:hypothetical protein
MKHDRCMEVVTFLRRVFVSRFCTTFLGLRSCSKSCFLVCKKSKNAIFRMRKFRDNYAAATFRGGDIRAGDIGADIVKATFKRATLGQIL